MLSNYNFVFLADKRLFDPKKKNLASCIALNFCLYIYIYRLSFFYYHLRNNLKCLAIIWYISGTQMFLRIMEATSALLIHWWRLPLVQQAVQIHSTRASMYRSYLLLTNQVTTSSLLRKIWEQCTSPIVQFSD